MFIAISIEIIETRDIPMAVLKAKLKDICLERINVSKAIDVNIPFTIAKDIIAKTDQVISVNWKKAIVPKSPIQQPNKHQEVFLDA
tara:strand:- start:139 stop:396 length:258 start_codon:yes stop_codon:yes gene_type:complete